MDELVKQGLARWPEVPECYGWLALDARGAWRIGRERKTITHAATVDFINRNYTSDEKGRWLFQNGPQRVYVDLTYTPYVWHLGRSGQKWQLFSHDKMPCPSVDGIWIDDTGQFLFQAEEKIGVLHDHDSAWFEERLCRANGAPFVGDEGLAQVQACMAGQTHTVWIDSDLLGPLRRIEPISREDVPARFGFDPHPKKLTAPAALKEKLP